MTSTLVLEGDGRVAEYVGGYDDWKRQCRTPVHGKVVKAKPKPKFALAPTRQRPTKPSYAQQRELDVLPAQIEALEDSQRQIHTAMADARFYRRDKAVIAADQARLQEIEESLAQAYRRWEALEQTGPSN